LEREKFWCLILTPIDVSFLYSKLFDIYCVPRVINERMNELSKFYKEKHIGRKFTWIHSLSQGTIIANYPNTKIKLVLSTIHFSILDQFNENDEKSIEEIQNQLGINIDILNTFTNDLIQKKLLNKSMNDTIEYNKNFKYDKPIINLFSHSWNHHLSSVDYKKNDKVSEDQKYIIESIIIKIMKSKRQIAHDRLIMEVRSKVNFDIKITEIKKRIESLIEREYIERFKSNQSIQIYRYIS
jgi:DNA-binding MarR family transcriptional regulator